MPIDIINWDGFDRWGKGIKWPEKHPDKTIMGRTIRGFDFLGYHFGPEGVTLAKKTIANFTEKALRLYEKESPHRGMGRLGEYY